MRCTKQILAAITVFCLLAVTSAHGVAVPQNPENVDPRDLQILAILYIQENRPLEALPLLEHAVDLYPENGETHMWQGVALFLTGQFEESEEAFMRALSRNPGLSDVRNYMGLLRYKQGDLDAAVREFRTALQDPAYPPQSKARVHLNLGNVYLELGNPAAALDHLAQGVAVSSARSDPIYEPLHVQLANALRELDRTQEAIAALNKIVEINADHVEAQLLLGLSYRDLAQYRVARMHLRKVIQLAPGTELSERAQAALAQLPG